QWSSDVAACDQQNETHRGEKRNEARAEIPGHVFRQSPQCGDECAVDVVRILGPITLFQRQQYGARLLNGHPRFQSSDNPQKKGAAHQLLMTEAGNLKRFRRPNFRDRVRAKPGRRHIWQNANDRVWRSVECDASPNHVRISAEALLPEIFRHQCDVGAFLFFWQKIAAKNWANAQHIEIVGGYSPAKNLDRIAKSGQCERGRILGGGILGGETVKNRLTVTIKLVTRRRYSDIRQIARLVAVIEVNNARRFLERQPAQKQIVDQTKDRRVQPDAERERDDRDSCKSGRLAKLAESEF